MVWVVACSVGSTTALKLHETAGAWRHQLRTLAPAYCVLRASLVLLVTLQTLAWYFTVSCIRLKKKTRRAIAALSLSVRTPRSSASTTIPSVVSPPTLTYGPCAVYCILVLLIVTGHCTPGALNREPLHERPFLFCVLRTENIFVCWCCVG